MAKHLFFQRWALMNKATARLAQATSHEEVLEMLRESARAIALSDGVAVVRRHGEQVEYVGEDAITPLWTGQRFPIHTCISGIAMLERRPILIPDILKDPRVPLNAYLSTFVRSMAMFPIGTGEPTAALGLYWKDVKPLSPDVAVLIDYLARGANTAFALIAIRADKRGAQAAVAA